MVITTLFLAMTITTMIAYLKGKVKYHGDEYVVLEVANVGYKVFATETLLGKLQDSQEAELYIYQNIREDASDLYGFEKTDDLNLFEKLNSVSGIGPRSALGVLKAAPAEEIVKAIMRGDERSLVTVYGISKKKAEKIILELKGKIDKMGYVMPAGEKAPRPGSRGVDIIEALIGLGYTNEQAREALREISPDVTKAEDMIREALKILGKK